MSQVALKVECGICHKEETLEMTSKQYYLYQGGLNHVQDIFPEYTPEQRELLISNICGECYEELFTEKEDGYEDEEMIDEFGQEPDWENCQHETTQTIDIPGTDETYTICSVCGCEA